MAYGLGALPTGRADPCYPVGMMRARIGGTWWDLCCGQRTCSACWGACHHVYMEGWQLGVLCLACWVQAWERWQADAGRG